MSLKFRDSFYRIPVFLTGILFFAVLSSAAEVELAVQLFEEGDWAGCRTESLRVLLADPENESARLFSLLSALKQGDSDAYGLLKTLASSAQAGEIRTLASYEAGRQAWEFKEYNEAFALLKYAFGNTSSYDLFLRSGCSLNLLMQDEKSLREGAQGLDLQLRASEKLWSDDLQAACRIEKEEGSGLLSLPGAWIVSLYRSQIAPAIGMRCSLTPSCSEYFRLACQQHGVLGFAIQADRFIREPSVVAAAENPVVAGRIIKYEDPVEDHTKWLKK